MKKKIIIIILLIIVALTSIGYILYKKYGGTTYIGKIESINDKIVVAYCYDGRNRENINEGMYKFSTEDVLILNEKGKKIDVSKLNVGNTVEIYLRHDALIKATFPEAGISKNDIKKIKVLNK